MIIHKNLIVILFFLNFTVVLDAQLENDFEDNNDFSIEIDSTIDSNIWQIGPPVKPIFSSAFSLPNAIVTDTINNYPINNTSTFEFEIDFSSFWTQFPYFMVLWNQKMDCEVGVDGGIIEVSYDSAQTWINIFEDHPFQPNQIGNINMSVLHNGEMGISKVDSEWEQVGFCWFGSNGKPIGKILYRFTFVSNNTESNQEGWMIDNFISYETVIDAVDDIFKNNNNALNVEIYPNPAQDEINLKIDDQISKNGWVQIMDLTGTLVLRHELNNTGNSSIDISNLQLGHYILVVKNSQGEMLCAEQFLKSKTK